MKDMGLCLFTTTQIISYPVSIVSAGAMKTIGTDSLKLLGVNEGENSFTISLNDMVPT